ncbi:MAG TPA: hypothetical protein GX704_06055 [Clostridiales bacterium]|jgi:hypothetical protein|nr:hypothetical protein [Clostridiales bacterium]
MINLLPYMLLAAANESSPEVFFEPMNFVSNLKYMGIGMLVIFVVIGIIMLATSLLNRIFSK